MNSERKLVVVTFVRVDGCSYTFSSLRQVLAPDMHAQDQVLKYPRFSAMDRYPI